MQIVYCDNCGLRIPDKEFDAGRAVKTGERNFCEKCAPKADARRLAPTPVPAAARGSSHKMESAPPRSSAAGLTPAQRLGINHNADAREQRQPATSPPKSNAVLPIALGVGALVLGGVLLLGNGSTPPKTSASAPAPANNSDRVVANDATKAAPSGEANRVAEATRKNPAVAVPAATAPAPDSDAAVKPGPNPERLAEAALDKALKFDGVAPDDKAGRIKILNEFLAVHGDTMVATRAWQLVKALHADLDREAHERQLALQMPASVITGSIETSNDVAGSGGRAPAKEVAAGTAGAGGTAAPGAPSGTAQTVERAAAQAKAAAPKSDDKALDDQPDVKKAAAAKATPAAAAQLDAVRKELAPLLQQQRFDAAVELLDRRLSSSAAADAKELLLADKADLNAILQLRQAAVNAVRELAGKSITLKRGKSDLTGTVVVDPARPGITLKSDSGMEMAFAPEQFQAQDIDAFAPQRSGSAKADDLRTRGILYYDINELPKAREYFKSAQDAGANVASYLDRIAAADEETAEARARAEFGVAESAYQLKHYESAEKGFRAFKATYGKSKTYVQLESQLKLRLDAIEFALRPFAEGLSGKYYRGKDFRDEDFVFERTDDKIDFGWEKKPPAPNAPRENFCARWTGLIRIDRGGKYTFTTIVDDCARLTIDGKQVINDWTDGHGAKPVSGSIELAEGFHDLTLDYCQFGGPACIHLMWFLKDTFSETLVPPDVLFHRQPRKSSDK